MDFKSIKKGWSKCAVLKTFAFDQPFFEAYFESSKFIKNNQNLSETIIQKGPLSIKRIFSLVQATSVAFFKFRRLKSPVQFYSSVKSLNKTPFVHP
jgi:hypothetical protein